MKIIIKPAFKRDSDRVHTKELLQALSYKIEQIENAKSIQHITGLKKLRGYITYYRIYVKVSRQSYRIGAIIKGNTIWLVRFLPRRVIYRKFP
jgi:mRNA interferase RelE/StbE